MAEEGRDAIHQHTTGVKEEETLSASNDDVPARDEHKPTDLVLNEKQQHSEDAASSSASANREAKNENDEDEEQLIENGDSAENKMVPPTEGSSPPEEDGLMDVENSSLHQADDESHGDYSRESPKKEESAVIAEATSREDHTGEKKAPETTTSPILGHQVDGPKARPSDGSLATNDTITEAEEYVGTVLAPEEEKDPQVNKPSPQTPLPENMSMKEELDEQRNDVETIGPTTQEKTEPTVPEVIGTPGGSRRYVIAVGMVVFVAILVQHLLQPGSPPQKSNVRQIDIFLKQMEKLKTQFPKQRTEVWNRSRIHLQRHLQTAQPTEPVSLILTAGLRAEKTLHCLAHGLASAFSSALNASFLHIDGVSKASQDSDQVKLDIDSKLQGAFEGDKPVAVIHRFEELPPGSTLIFYRYCDHENAAYKKTFLIFTVLLGEEEEIPAKIRLSAVEEMVDDHLQKKFLSHGHPISFDRMDLDKYGGLWSRISHLILPVAAEERLEHEGC